MITGISSKYIEDFSSVYNNIEEVGTNNNDNIKNIESFTNEKKKNLSLINNKMNKKNNNKYQFHNSMTDDNMDNNVVFNKNKINIKNNKINSNSYSKLNPSGERNNSKNHMFEMRGNNEIPKDYDGLEDDEFELTNEITSNMERNNINTSNPQESPYNPKPTIINKLNNKDKPNVKMLNMKENMNKNNLNNNEYNDVSSEIEDIEKLAEEDYKGTINEEDILETNEVDEIDETEKTENDKYDDENIEEPFVGSSITGKQALKILLLSLLITLFVYILLSKEVLFFVKKVVNYLPQLSLEFIQYSLIFIVIYISLLTFI